MEEKTRGSQDPSLPNLQGRHGDEGTYLLAWSPGSSQAQWSDRKIDFWLGKLPEASERGWMRVCCSQVQYPIRP